MNAAPFFRPANEAQLVAQINQVILGARSCKFTLNGNVQAGREAQGTVTLNGVRLNFNDNNGWKLLSPNQIELQGTACTTVKTVVNASLSARFPCDAVIKIK
jgi:hypothetical protein